MSMWLFFGLLGPIMWGTSNVMGGAIRRKYVQNDFALTWFLAMMRLPFVVALFLIHPVHLTLNSSSIMLMVAGMLWVFPFILYYYALNFEEPSRVALSLQSVQIFTLIGSFFLLHERLTPHQWAGFALLFLGGILAAFKRMNGKWHLSKILILITLSCICWAFSDIFFRKYSLEIGDFWTSFSWYFFGSFLVAPFMMIVPKYGTKMISHFKGLSKRGYALLFGDQLIGTLGSIFFAYALSLGMASLTGVLQAIQPLAAFFMALVLPRLIPEIDHENTSGHTLFLKGISFLFILFGLIALSL